MANEQHLALLQRGTEVWNAWREKEPKVQPDLSGADLREADLMLANLRGTNLQSADLSYADLSFANLSYADLSLAVLSYADLSGVDLSGADLRQAILHEAVLNGTNLERADFQGAILSGADFQGTDTERAFFDNPSDRSDHRQTSGFAAWESVFESATPASTVAPAPGTTLNELQLNRMLTLPTAPAATPEELSKRVCLGQGFTEPVFEEDELFITVKQLSAWTGNASTVSFSLGAVGYPLRDIERVEAGYRMTYLDRYQVFVVSLTPETATFIVDKIEPEERETPRRNARRTGAAPQTERRRVRIS